MKRISVIIGPPTRPKSFGRALGTAATVLTVGAMLGYVAFGPTGLFAWGDYNAELSRKTIELAKLQDQEARLRNRTELVDPASADPDLVDELVRRELNVTDPREIVIPRR